MSKKRNRRTEELSVNFVNRLAEGWVFGVGDCFRMQLDIRLDERIDKEANLRKEFNLGRKLEQSEKLTRMVWTQGSPPAFAFDRGHLFHEQKESPEGLRRSIYVLLARPDAGASVEKSVTDEDGSERTVITEVEGDRNGFVDYEILTYKNGKPLRDEDGVVIKEQSSRTQADFAEFLRTGE
jgi:hypothetical protein